jgi:hypothetical protein
VRSLGVLRKRRRGSVNGCSITTTSGRTRGSGDCALLIGILRSRESCEERWSEGSRRTCWRWHCEGSRGSHFTW